MSVKVHARFTLRVVSRGQAKRAVDAAAPHGFHNCRDHDLPVPRGMAEQPFVTKGVKIFKARLFQPANIRRVGKFPPEGLFFLFPFLVKRGCAGVRTNNKTGISHFAFLYLYPSYFKLHVRWLRSFTPVTYLCKLLGIHSLAAFLQLELFRVYQKINLIR